MLKALEEYERLNLADALVTRTFTDGTLIIKQVHVFLLHFSLRFAEGGLIQIKLTAAKGNSGV